MSAFAISNLTGRPQPQGSPVSPILLLVIAVAVAPVSATAASGIYQQGSHTLFYLPLDGPNAGAPEDCSIWNPSLLSYTPDRFNNANSAIHVNATASASDFFAIACSNTRIAANTSGSFTVGYWERTSLSIPAGGNCGIPTGVCGFRNLTILASNTDNGGCRKYAVTQVSSGVVAGAFPAACTSGNGGTLLSSVTSIGDGTWHNFVWVFDYTHQVMTLYLDGVQNASGALAGPAPSAENAQYIAGAENGSFALDGDMDDFWIEDHPWTPIEVQHYYTALGIDTQSAVSPPEWKQLQQAKRTFFIVPAYGGGETGEGLFPENQLLSAQTAGLKVAAYCLLNFDEPDQPQPDGTVKWSGTWQVQKAIASVGTELASLNFMAIDVERSGIIPITLCKTSPSKCVTRVQEAVAAVVAAKLKPIIYTNKTDWPVIIGYTDNRPTPFSYLPLWESVDDFSPTLTFDGPYAPKQPDCSSYAPTLADLSAWTPFGGWSITQRVGKQYSIGCDRQGTYLAGIAVRVDLDVFDPSMFLAH